MRKLCVLLFSRASLGNLGLILVLSGLAIFLFGAKSKAGADQRASSDCRSTQLDVA